MNYRVNYFCEENSRCFSLVSMTNHGRHELVKTCLTTIKERIPIVLKWKIIKRGVKFYLAKFWLFPTVIGTGRSWIRQGKWAESGRNSCPFTWLSLIKWIITLFPVHYPFIKGLPLHCVPYFNMGPILIRNVFERRANFTVRVT